MKSYDTEWCDTIRLEMKFQKEKEKKVLLGLLAMLAVENKVYKRIFEIFEMLTTCNSNAKQCLVLRLDSLKSFEGSDKKGMTRQTTKTSLLRVL